MAVIKENVSIVPVEQVGAITARHRLQTTRRKMFHVTAIRRPVPSVGALRSRTILELFYYFIHWIYGDGSMSLGHEKSIDRIEYSVPRSIHKFLR